MLIPATTVGGAKNGARVFAGKERERWKTAYWVREAGGQSTHCRVRQQRSRLKSKRTMTESKLMIDDHIEVLDDRSKLELCTSIEQNQLIRKVNPQNGGTTREGGAKRLVGAKAGSYPNPDKSERLVSVDWPLGLHKVRGNPFPSASAEATRRCARPVNVQPIPIPRAILLTASLLQAESQHGGLPQLLSTVQIVSTL